MEKIKWIEADQDDPILFTVFAAARQKEIAPWGWSDTEQEAFLRMQYDCRQKSYQMQYPQLERSIIQAEGLPIGQILLAEREGGYVLVDIALLPEFQNRGYGTALLKEIQERIAPGECLNLTVYKDNPAQNLYQQLGFHVIAETELYLMMEWRNVQLSSGAFKPNSSERV